MGDNRLEPLVLSEAERRTLENWAKRRLPLVPLRVGLDPADDVAVVGGLPR